MFNNAINRHDFRILIEKMRTHPRRTIARLADRLSGNSTARVEKAWAHTKRPPQSWYDIPEVRERTNRLVSGDAQVDHFEYLAGKYLAGRQGLTALSLGCGTGHRERRWAELGMFARIDAYDLSAPRIQHAVDAAKQAGQGDIINFQVGNIYAVDMGIDRYDVVLGESSLHHFTPLDELLTKVECALKPDGYFFVNEFVGPTRFQWTENQLEIINGLLAVFPERYRQRLNGNPAKRVVFRPSRLRMHLIDPSEAVESSRILPLLEKGFDVVETRNAGGTVLQLLFNEIAHNFIPGDETSQKLLETSFETEDRLLESGEIPSDFVVAVCRPRR